MRRPAFDPSTATKCRPVKLLSALIIAVLAVAALLPDSPTFAGEQPFTKGTLASLITTPFDGAASVVWADLDGDGDLDAVSAGATDDQAGEVAWWKNNGASFSPRIAIDNAFCGARDVHAADIDGDGDLDVVATSFYGDNELVLCSGSTTHLGELAWWENTAGDATTWSSKKTITNAVDEMAAVTTADLDCDGYVSKPIDFAALKETIAGFAASRS